MKIVPSKHAWKTPAQETEAILPLLPESDEDINSKDSMQCSTLKLRTDPTSRDSPVYSFTVLRVDGTQSVRRHIKWLHDLNKVHAGLNATTAAEQHRINLDLCQGEVKTAYEIAAAANRAHRYKVLKKTAREQEPARDEAGGETEEEYKARLTAAEATVQMPAYNDQDVNSGYLAVMTDICPYKALETQKRFMRRKMRKPADMRTRTYINLLVRINRDELPLLPPMRANQALTADEITEIVVFGLPKSWLREMYKMDFDPYQETLQRITHFCDRLEQAEATQTDSIKVQSNSNKKKKTSHAKGSSNEKGKWCEYHETDTHNTSECSTLKKLKASKNAGGKQPPNKNKTWKRKSDDAKTFSKKELSAIAKKAGKAAVKSAKKEANAVVKRKVKYNPADEDSDDNSVNSLNAFDKSMKDIDEQLKEFNFDDLKEDGEISC